jgi:hypothetical protein
MAHYCIISIQSQWNPAGCELWQMVVSSEGNSHAWICRFIVVLRKEISYSVVWRWAHHLVSGVKFRNLELSLSLVIFLNTELIRSDSRGSASRTGICESFYLVILVIKHITYLSCHWCQLREIVYAGDVKSINILWLKVQITASGQNQIIHVCPICRLCPEV